jgi:hypothetical protein
MICGGNFVERRVVFNSIFSLSSPNEERAGVRPVVSTNFSFQVSSVAYIPARDAARVPVIS